MSAIEELKELISLVKNSTKPVNEIVESYMAAIGWSLLKSEFDRMSSDERAALYRKLETQRK